MQPIPKTFYKDAVDFMANLKQTATSKQVTKESTSKILNELFEKRKQKILIYVAYKKQLPQPASMLENEFYSKVLEIANANRIETIELAAKTNIIELKSLRDIPEIVLPSGAKVGPLTKNQAIELKDPIEKDIEFLVSNTICERI